MSSAQRAGSSAHPCASSSLAGALVQLVARCLRGEGDDAVYVHCLAGRGRTGVVCAVVLGALYGLSADAALALIQRFHDSRISPFGRGARSPENDVQRAQVHRVAKRPELRVGLFEVGTQPAPGPSPV